MSTSSLCKFKAVAYLALKIRREVFEELDLCALRVVALDEDLRTVGRRHPIEMVHLLLKQTQGSS